MMANAANHCSRCIGANSPSPRQMVSPRGGAYGNGRNRSARVSLIFPTGAGSLRTSTRLKISPLMPSSGSLADFATHLSVDAARARVRDLCVPRALPAESIDLERALGRVLASDVIVPHDLPPFSNSAMDGYALQGADLASERERRFRVAGYVLAGAVQVPRFETGECIRITTGAPLPPGADTVVIKEHVRIDGDEI